MPGVMRPYLTTHRCKKKYKLQVRCKMTVYKMTVYKITVCEMQDNTVYKTTSYKGKCKEWEEN